MFYVFKCLNWADLSLCLVYNSTSVPNVDFDSLTNELHFGCSQMWPKKVKECSTHCVHVSPLWELDDSHSDTRVAVIEDVIAFAAQHHWGYLHFTLCTVILQSWSLTGTNWTRKWSTEMTLEWYDDAWMRTLQMLIRYSQWNMIINDSQANKGEIWTVQLGCSLAVVLSASGHQSFRDLLLNT